VAVCRKCSSVRSELVAASCVSGKAPRCVSLLEKPPTTSSPNNASETPRCCFRFVLFPLRPCACLCVFFYVSKVRSE
uniref:Uncharacterized protein n=1 Tax=Anopheles dirus TaxID=7168 RepID=A0A182NXS6_9DIPT